MIHTVKAFSIVNEAEVDNFLEFSCFFYDPLDVSNLISGSFAFSISSLYVWKFSVQVLLKPSLKDFKHYLASMWNEHNCMVVWNSLALPFFGIGMKTYLSQSFVHCWVFQICWHIEFSSLTASSFRNHQLFQKLLPLDLSHLGSLLSLEQNLKKLHQET